jgi:osmotically inducible protein OsmC
MAVRTASAKWNGDLQSGSGTMALGSGAFEGQFSFRSRFEDGPGTNPEELIGAAHAGCFSMALSNILAEGGNPPDAVETSAKVHFGPTDAGPTIQRIELTTRGKVPGLDDAGFKEAADAAKAGCPVSRALTGVEIEVDAALA